MSKDIVPELWETIEEEFKRRLEDSKIIKALQKKMEEGSLTAEDSFVYAKEIGDIRKSVLKEIVTEDVLPDGRMYFNIAERILGDSLFEDYEMISSFSQEAFTQVNREAGIGLKGVSVPYDEDKTKGIVDLASNAEQYSDVRDLVEETVTTNAKGYHDEAVRRNADFQYRSGMRPKIIRTAFGKTCKWCRDLAGTYDYGDLEDNEVFRRHENCDCLVVYSPKKGSYQDVHSKDVMDILEYRSEKKKRMEIAQQSNSSLVKPVVHSEKYSTLKNDIRDNWEELVSIEKDASKEDVKKLLDRLGFAESYYITDIKKDFVGRNGSNSVVLTKGNLAYVLLRHANHYSGFETFYNMKNTIDHYDVAVRGKSGRNDDLIFYKLFKNNAGDINGLEIKMNKRNANSDEYIVHFLELHGRKATKKLSKYLADERLIDSR